MPCIAFVETVSSTAAANMITRYAVFSGELQTGKESQMRTYVNNVLAPLWRQFTGAHVVRVLFQVEQDPEGPTIPLVLAISYADETAMQRALESPARYESRDLLPDFYREYFESVSLYHYVMDTAEIEPAT